MTMMRGCWIVIATATIAAAHFGATAAENPAGRQPADTTDSKASSNRQPSCSRCGATCGLRPVCVCKPGTRTVAKPEFSTACEPLCVPGCGSRPWPWCRPSRSWGCTTCTDEPCECAGRVRQRKVLSRKTVEEQQPVIEHSVGHLCCACAAAQPSRCEGGCPPPRGPWRDCLDWLTSLWRH